MAWGVHDYPSPPPEDPLPVCPVCGAELSLDWDSWIIRDVNGEIIGCNNCLNLVYASTYAEELMEE